MGSGGTPLQEPPVHPFTAAEDIRKGCADEFTADCLYVK